MDEITEATPLVLAVLAVLPRNCSLTSMAEILAGSRLRERGWFLTISSVLRMGRPFDMG